MHEPRRFVFGHNFVMLIEHFLRIYRQQTISDHKMDMTEKINNRCDTMDTRN